MNEEDKREFIEQRKLLFQFLIKKNQWSGLEIDDYIRWRNNFKDIEDGEYISTRLLDFLLYYSEKDIAIMLEHLISDIFLNEVVLPLEKRNNFSVTTSEIEFAVNKEVNSTIIVPLVTEFEDPAESGLGISRTIRNQVNNQFQFLYSKNIERHTECRRLIIVDDCIGSGKQFEEFWNTAEISNGIKLQEWVREKMIHTFYIACVGYRKVVDQLNSSYIDITIKCAELLDEEHRVFSKESKCWSSYEESEASEQILSNYLSEKAISLRGYSDLDFAVALHNDMPDWSLPLFYKNKCGWQHLIKGKSTYD